MGCNASVPQSDESDSLMVERRVNDAIDHTLNALKQNSKNQVRLLLLGAGESGKSTVLKQLKLLHKGGFSDQERLQYAHVIWVDAIQAMKILLVQAKNLGISLDCDNASHPLNKYKHIVWNANALEQIDTSIAGGTNFINDYVIKYSEGRRAKRKPLSTGIPGTALWNDSSTKEAAVEVDMSVYDTPESTNADFTRVQIAESIDCLWKYDHGIKECFSRSNEFQLDSSAQYYFENIYKFADTNYVCNDTDILLGRIKTTGITETNFNINSFKFKVLDAGGQRAERKKWIHCFDNINAILFVVAVSEYDQMLFEDERVNRMQEAIVLFDSLCNSRYFINTPFILFFNKTDLFRQKIKNSPLHDYFPQYKGKEGDFDDGIKFFENIFLKLNKGNKPIYVHRTCATDTGSMKFVLSAVTDVIIEESLKKSGII